MSEQKKEFVKLLRSIDPSRMEWEKFYDFCELSALTMRMPFYGNDVVAILKEKFGRYKKPDIQRFDAMFNCLVDAMEAEYQDFLGDIFQELGLSSRWKGQFFTPMCVCRMMAKVSIGDTKSSLNASGYFTCNDPACGAGALLIAAVDELRLQGMNPSTCIYIEAQDIDQLAAYMCYIQLSLCGVAAKIIHGNSLSMEIFSEAFTPVYFLNDWPRRIQLQAMLDFLRSEKSRPAADIEVVREEPTPKIKKQGQLLLFE